MRTIEVEQGSTPPDDKDRVTVSTTPSGKYDLSAVVGAPNLAIFMDPAFYDSAEEAREAGLAWARSHGSVEIHVVMPKTPI